MARIPRRRRDEYVQPGARCAVCGGGLEAGRQPAPGATAICYGCELDTWLPGWYLAAECYAYDRTWGHKNARARPKTGRVILDAPSGPRIYLFVARIRGQSAYKRPG